MSSKMPKISPVPDEQDYIIAYIDLLGTRERLMKEPSSEFFKEIYYQFLIADRIIPDLERFLQFDIRIKIFSDNILVAIPVENPSNNNEVLSAYRCLCDYIRLPLCSFVKKGILFRGAITIDKLYINDLMAWGNGLVCVVDLEEKVAIYPRIVLSKELLDVFERFCLDGSEYEETFCCLKDEDDCVFFDIIDYNDFGSTEGIFEKATPLLNRQITRARKKNDLKVLQKLNWFKNYLNRAFEIYMSVKSDYEDELHGKRDERQRYCMDWENTR